MSTPRRIEIYDTTLRDGTQGEGFNLSLQDKLLIAAKLDELGVDYIEGGFPLSNPKDEQFFRDVRELKLKNAKVAAFGMTRRRGVKAEDDPGMKALLAAETPVITIVGKSSEFHVTTVLGVSPEENLAMIGDTIKLMRQGGRQVVYDAEHFFDAYKANPAYAIRTLLAAQEAGASVLALCDTNGGTMPELIAEAVAAVKEKTSAMVGIHTHNDAGVAVANALTAIRNGAAHAQGTINGVGERCGNMDLITLIANLQLKYKFDCLRPGTLRHLTETSRYVYETANYNLVSGQPYVGASAFAHKGGMHVHAVQKDVSTYEHVSPETVGNTRKILISELSGVSNIATKAGKKFDLENDKETLRKVLVQVQDLENAGYHFEVAEASFELLLRKQIGRYRKFFDLDHYRDGQDSRRAAGGASRRRRGRAGGRARSCAAEGTAGALPRHRAGAFGRLQSARDQLERGDGGEGARRRREPAGEGGWDEGAIRDDRGEREHHRRELASAGGCL